jgi:hypothetical protein
MALKPKLVVVGAVVSHQVKYFSWTALPYFKSILSEFFDFESYDANKKYDSSTWFVISVWCYRDLQAQFRDRNVIIDVCLEANMPVWSEIYSVKEPHHIVMYGSVPVNNNQKNILYVPNFFWYNEALSQPREFVGNFNYNKKFLMPIGRKTSWRDAVVEKLTPYLDDAYWSYVRRGRALPGEPDSVPGAKRWNTRYENPMWYNDTCFSVVLESITSWGDGVPFLTEKIFKPIRHQHPFMVVGAPGILEYTKSQGFETFDNLFDESYDQEHDLDVKLKIIISNIQAFVKQPFDQLTLEKGQHNQELFYNQAVIVEGIKKSIAEPVLEIIENTTN